MKTYIEIYLAYPKTPSLHGHVDLRVQVFEGLCRAFVSRELFVLWSFYLGPSSYFFLTLRGAFSFLGMRLAHVQKKM